MPFPCTSFIKNGCPLAFIDQLIVSPLSYTVYGFVPLIVPFLSLPLLQTYPDAPLFVTCPANVSCVPSLVSLIVVSIS